MKRILRILTFNFHTWLSNTGNLSDSSRFGSRGKIDRGELSKIEFTCAVKLRDLCDVLKVYVDTVGKEDYYQQKLESLFPNLKITVTSKASESSIVLNNLQFDLSP